MFKLEDIVVGARLDGVVSGESVVVVSAVWRGDDGLTVFHKSDSGALGERLFYRDDENSPTIQLVEKSRVWSFDGDGAITRLVLEAWRIKLAWFFDPYLAVHSSEITPLPHQISAVYEQMLPRLPLRYLLADDPGAGKTIMAGLLIKEQIARGDLRRCLIVTPGSLSEQWQDELLQKFNLNFRIITNELLESAASGNAFAENDLCIARLDKLARNEDVKNKLLATDWDLIICDEAHKMSATIFGGEVKESLRFKLGRELAKIARNFLLLTATPHNGKNEDFQLFLSLIDQDRFEGRTRTSNQAIEVGDVMRRLVKEELLTFEGKPLFPERRAYVANYRLSDKEAALYQAVTDYVREEFNRADALNKKRRSNVGFALTSLQRRLASSPEAIYNSLSRRRKRLEKILKEVQIQLRAEKSSFSDAVEEFDEDELTGKEVEQIEDSAVEGVSAAQTEAELEAEIETVERLEKLADETRQSGEDRKWRELSNLLQDKSAGMYDAEGLREKLIIFTEHKDTLNYLVDKIGRLLGNHGAVVSIYGGTTRDQRRKIEEEFKHNPEVKILVATDAAGEGVNLQRAHLMINYDLPWNPNRLEQRFGRIHRIGQKEVCHLWNLVANETREGDVFQRLFDKIERERQALGGKVFDVLGKLTFDEKQLRDLIVEAIRYNNSEEARSRMEETMDATFDREKLLLLLRQNALTDDVADASRIMEVREEMERAEARKLQPYFIESFFRNAFEILGGHMVKREQGRFAVLKTPFEIRNRGTREPIASKYERVCFDKKYCDVPGKPKAQLIAPGFALLDATSDLIRERYSNVLKQGTIFVDETDFGQTARLLFYVETAVQDGVSTENGTQRVISRNVSFIELQENGAAVDAGAAPYLDYRPLREEEKEPARAFLETQDWLKDDLEERVQAFVVANVASKLFSQIKEKRLKQVAKIRDAVRKRLTSEIRYWEHRYVELSNDVEEGKPNAKVNADLARRRADDLENRLRAREIELDKTSDVSARAPLIRGGALIIPRGLFDRLTDAKSEEPSTFARDVREIERIAVETVLKIERSSGFEPRDVGAENRGYDVESTIPPEKRQEGDPILRFIEVKGRRAGAATVTVTKNEILTALNKPEDYFLALVEIGDDSVKTTYLRKPFQQTPDFSAASVNYDVAKLKREAEIAYESCDPR